MVQFQSNIFVWSLISIRFAEIDQYSGQSSSSSTSNRSAESGSRKRKSDQMLPSLNKATGHDVDVNNDDDEDAVLSVNGSAAGSSEDDGEKPKKKRRKEFLNLNATFMTGVPGVHLVIDQVRYFFLYRMHWIGLGGTSL